MQIVEIRTKKDKKAFHRLPFKIYADDPNWIPHLKQDVEAVFDPEKNKLLRKGKAKRWLLYNDKSDCIGRVAAFIDAKKAFTFEQPTGGMGFFECINDKEAAFTLFDTCKKWLDAENMEAMDGPVNFGEKNMFWGLLVENFKDISPYGMNYNPPYYRDFFESYGFQKYFEQWVYKRDMHVPAQEVFYRKYNQIKNDPNVEIKNGKGKTLKQLALDFKVVYNDAWKDHSNFKPLTDKAAIKLFNKMKPAVDKNILVFVYYKKEPVAFWINLPELNQIFRYVNGNLNLLGKLKFLYHKWKKTPDIMTGIVFGVSREFQQKGYEAAMIIWGYENIVPMQNYNETVLSWIGDFNPRMIKVCENLGAKKYRTLYTYRYLFDRNKKFERKPII